MRELLTELLQEARAAGLPISVAESVDALRAASAVGVDREILREALAATVVKEEADRDVFDEIFDRFFAVAEVGRARRPRGRPAAGTGQGRSGPRGGGAESLRRPNPDEEPKPGRRARATRAAAAPAKPRPGASADLLRRKRRHDLLRKPFADLAPDEAGEITAFVEQLARRFRTRLARRLRRDRRGRLDFRRTIRGSIAHGGAALRLELRRRRKARADLVVLCDLSGSVRHAAEIFARIVSSCGDSFRSIRLLVYVDHPVPASVEDGRLVPHHAIDLHAFSDLGRVLGVLVEEDPGPFTKRTVVVILGDARNNRRPARADLLARIRASVRAIWWLVPEDGARWSTGDSALDLYRPWCDQQLECTSAEQLLAAIERLPW